MTRRGGRGHPRPSDAANAPPRNTRAAAALLLLLIVILIVALFALRVLGPPRADRTPPVRANVPAPSGAARNLLLVTIDTLRADHVGAYGYRAGTTPTLDRIAHDGVRFDRAYATAPITLPSHASILTGRYPPGHGARANLTSVLPGVPTLASVLRAAGFQAAAFIAAFPLDRRFGLAAGFDPYSDRMPRDAFGKPLNERPGRDVVDEALAWLTAHGRDRFFAWVHLFEPHAPYGNPEQASSRSAIERYDDEIRIADAQVARLLDGLGPMLAGTLVIVVGDHGEAFGEHGETGHSIFVYDTTLRVPWVMMGPGVPRAAVVGQTVSLVDVAPTVLALLNAGRLDADGLDIRPSFSGASVARSEIYAESFEPLVDFGWSPFRSIRSGGLKMIAAPRSELYDVADDPGETRNLAEFRPSDLARLLDRTARYSSTALTRPAGFGNADREAVARLNALGYVRGTAAGSPGSSRVDPKDRRELAARIGQVTSGELRGADLEAALTAIVREDPGNPQAQLWFGDHLVRQARWQEAATHFRAAITAQAPSVDAHIGLAACQSALGDMAGAARTLRQASAREPGNAVVWANLGELEAASGRESAAIETFGRALAIDPDLHEARFNLARAYARSGRRTDAEREVRTLLSRLPASAPQRPEVERLLAAVAR